MCTCSVSPDLPSEAPGVTSLFVRLRGCDNYNLLNKGCHRTRTTALKHSFCFTLKPHNKHLPGHPPSFLLLLTPCDSLTSPLPLHVCASCLLLLTNCRMLNCSQMFKTRGAYLQLHAAATDSQATNMNEF